MLLKCPHTNIIEQARKRILYALISIYKVSLSAGLTPALKSLVANGGFVDLLKGSSISLPSLELHLTW